MQHRWWAANVAIPEMVLLHHAVQVQRSVHHAWAFRKFGIPYAASTATAMHTRAVYLDSDERSTLRWCAVVSAMKSAQDIRDEAFKCAQSASRACVGASCSHRNAARYATDHAETPSQAAKACVTALRHAVCFGTALFGVSCCFVSQKHALSPQIQSLCLPSLLPAPRCNPPGFPAQITYQSARRYEAHTRSLTRSGIDRAMALCRPR